MKYIKKYNENFISNLFNKDNDSYLSFNENVIHYYGRSYFKEIADGIREYLDEVSDYKSGLTKQDVLDKVEEFNIIKSDNKYVFVDMISLNSLCDFYNVKFDKSNIKKRIARSTHGSLTNTESGIFLGHSNRLEFVNERLRKFNESSELYTISQKVKSIVDELSVDNINNFAITLDINLYTGLYTKAYDYIFYYNGDKYEISDNAGSFYTLKLNGDKVDMGKYPWSFNASTIEKDMLTAVTALYKKINTFYLSPFNKWYRLFFNYLVDHLNENRIDLIERIKEFEVIRNNEVDWISLNNLYDFYETPFDKEDIRLYFKTKIQNKSIILNESIFDIFNKKVQLLKKWNKILKDIDINNIDIQEIESLTYIRYIILLNNDKLEVTNKYDDDLQFSIKLNNQLINSSDKTQLLESQLYRKVRLLHHKIKAEARTNEILLDLMIRVFTQAFGVLNIKITEEEVLERLHEFDVINDDFKKNGRVDMMNLEKVLDFYNINSITSNIIKNNIKDIRLSVCLPTTDYTSLNLISNKSIRKLNIIE